MILSMTGGGAERQLAFMVPELRALGHDVHVAYVYDGIYLDQLRSHQCPAHQLKVASKYDARMLFSLWRILRTLRPDVIHTWLPHMDVLGGGLARVLRIPWVMSERSSAGMYQPTLLNGMRRRLGRHADAIVANSPGGAEYWADAGAPRSRIEVIPNFVLREELDAAPPLQDARIAASDEVILHVGRLSPDKNLSTVIAAMSELVRRRPHAKLVLCGEGPLLNQLTSEVKAANVEDHVLFAGFVSNVGTWLKRADALVAVSECEGHPNAVLEAMAAGAPVVVSNIDAYRNILDDTSALFASARDPEEIAAALAATLENRDAARARADRARRFVEPLSLHATVQRYDDFYRRLVASKGRLAERRI